MPNTIYGDIDKVSLALYNEELKSRTFALLYMYEQQPLIAYQRQLQDLIVGAVSFDKIKIQRHQKFCKYIELLTSILEPKPFGGEKEHSFVRRHILDAINLLDRIFGEIKIANCNNSEVNKDGD